MPPEVSMASNLRRVLLQTLHSQVGCQNSILGATTYNIIHA